MNTRTIVRDLPALIAGLCDVQATPVPDISLVLHPDTEPQANDTHSVIGNILATAHDVHGEDPDTLLEHARDIVFDQGAEGVTGRVAVWLALADIRDGRVTAPNTATAWVQALHERYAHHRRTMVAVAADQDAAEARAGALGYTLRSEPDVHHTPYGTVISI